MGETSFFPRSQHQHSEQGSPKRLDQDKDGPELGGKHQTRIRGLAHPSRVFPQVTAPVLNGIGMPELL